MVSIYKIYDSNQNQVLVGVWSGSGGRGGGRSGGRGGGRSGDEAKLVTEGEEGSSRSDPDQIRTKSGPGPGQMAKNPPPPQNRPIFDPILSKIYDF